MRVWGFGHREKSSEIDLTSLRRVNFDVHIFQSQPPRLDLPPEESTDLEELEQFAKMFKQKRIKLGNQLEY